MNLAEARKICHNYSAQGAVVLAIDSKGRIHVSSYANSKLKARALEWWIKRWLDSVLSIVPFGTVFGWGNEGHPKTLPKGTIVDEDVPREFYEYDI